MKKIIAANWKNNGSQEFVLQYFKYLLENINLNNEIVVFPPDLYLSNSAFLIKDNKCKSPNDSESSIHIGGQTLICGSGNNALTGGTNLPMFHDNGCTYILVGHSEVRSNLKEDFKSHLKAAIKDDFQPILCVGEIESDIKIEKLIEQLGDFDDITNSNKIKRVIVAYEPVWAIGTGKTPDITDISSTHKFIKTKLSEFSSFKDKDIMVLYGGSVNLKNAKDILSAPHVDGVLIGGASLDVKEFTNICNLKI